jgi:hypothetical protein
MIDRLIEIGRCNGIEMNVEKNWGNDNLIATILNTDYDRSRATREYGIFQLFGEQDVHMKLNLGLTWQKQNLTVRRLFSPANWT